MKKIIASLAAFSLILSVPSVIAQMPLGVPAMPAASLALEKVGVVAAAGGRVELTTPGQVGRIAQSGQMIYMGDEVTTDAQGHLQILLLDQTVFTIGPNSAIVIDKFVYDPKTNAGEIKASITKGVFRYVSGKIAAKNPDSVKVKLPTATIGFRGTIVGGSVESNGQGLVGLLGPGDNNDSGAQTGSFVINGDGGGQGEVNRTGFGVEVGADGGISNVFQLSDNQINGLTGGLGGGQGGNGGGNNQGGGGTGEGGLGGDTNMGNLSGENNALTGANSALTSAFENFSDSLSQISDDSAQQGRTLAGGGATSDAGGSTTSVTKVSELPLVSGDSVYHYFRDFVAGFSYTEYDSGNQPTVYSGTLRGSIDVNFNSDSAYGGIGGSNGGNSSFVQIEVADISLEDHCYFNVHQSFEPPSGDPSHVNAVYVFTGSGATLNGDFTATVELLNENSNVATAANIEVSYSKPGDGGSPDTGSGTMTAPRIEGPTDIDPGPV